MALGKVKELVSSNPVVIFSNKLCPHCVCVKQLFVQQALCVAKLKVLFNNNRKGAVSPPQVSFISQYLSIHYNFEDQSTLPNSSVDVGPRLQFRASHDLKAQQGEATMVAKLADPGYAFQLSSSFHSAGLSLSYEVFSYFKTTITSSSPAHPEFIFLQEPEDGGKLSIGENMIDAAGTATDISTNPLWVVKTRLQIYLPNTYETVHLNRNVGLLQGYI